MSRRTASLVAAGLISLAGAAEPSLAAASAAPVARQRDLERKRAVELERATAAAHAARAAESGVSVAAKGDTVITGSDSSGSYTLKLKDGEVVAAQLDGANVPLDRVIRKGDTVHILDENGQGRFEVKVGAHADDLDAPGFPAAVAVAGPRVRIGVTLEDVPDALADHLKLPRGKGVLITGVAEDGPAAKAGVEQNDIVVRIDDNDDVDSDSLREAVAKRNPGDPIRLRVIRKGEPRDISLSVVAAEDLASSRNTWMWRSPEGRAGQPDLSELARLRELEAERLAQMSDRLREQVERSFGKVRSPRAWGGLSEEAAEDIRRAVIDALQAVPQALSPEVMEEVQQALTEAFEEVRREGGAAAEQFDMRLFGEPGRDGVIVVPPTPPPAAAAPAPPAAPAEPRAQGQRRRAADPSEERLRAMEERMRRMEELLEKIAERDSRPSGQR